MNVRGDRESGIQAAYKAGGARARARGGQAGCDAQTEMAAEFGGAQLHQCARASLLTTHKQPI